MNFRNVAILLAFAALAACSSVDNEGEFDSFGGSDALASERADGFGLTQPEADAILKLVNTASFEVLDDDVALDVRAARNIVEARDKAPIATLDELDAISWVGSRALGKLREYVNANGLVGAGAEACLIISEYVEGKLNENKAVEIWNCGDAPVALDDVALCLIRNDDEDCTRATPLSGRTLAPNDTLVVCRDLHGNAFNDPVSWITQPCELEVGSTAIFSGDDRLAIVRDANNDAEFSLANDQVLDVLGRIGYRPLDNTWQDVRLDRCRLEPNDGKSFYLTEDWFHSEPWSNDRGSHLGKPPTRTSCDDPLSGVCVFGSNYGDLIGANDAIVVTSKARVTSPSEVSGIEADQLIHAVQVAYEEVTTLDEAFAAVDAGEVNIHRLWDASNGDPYISFEFGAGDNSYGRIFEAGTTTVAANILDLDLYDCTAFWGPQRRDCTSTADCADGLRCEGMRDGVGSCIETSFSPAGTGSQCRTSLDCPGSNGLVCGGENLGGGFCVAAWSRRTFELDRRRTIQLGRMEIPIDVYGLASVSTDVTVNMLATNEDYANLRISLQNPLGTEGVLFDGDANAREVSLRDQAVLAFPGDEDANGQWLLVIENPDGAVPGLLYRFQMTVTSRYD